MGVSAWGRIGGDNPLERSLRSFIYIVYGKLGTLYIERKRPSQRGIRKELKKRERKGLTKGEGSGILTKLSARNGVPAWAAAGTTEKTFEKLEKRA